MLHALKEESLVFFTELLQMNKSTFTQFLWNEDEPIKIINVSFCDFFFILSDGLGCIMCGYSIK